MGVVATAGEAGMAFQQIVEWMAVPGRDVIGPIPRDLQCHFDAKAAIFAASTHQAAARELLTCLAQPTHAATFQQAGLEQLTPSCIDSC